MERQEGRLRSKGEFCQASELFPKAYNEIIKERTIHDEHWTTCMKT